MRSNFHINSQPAIKLKRKQRIDHFTVVCPVTLPLNDSEAGGDPALIQTSLLLSSKCTWLV